MNEPSLIELNSLFTYVEGEWKLRRLVDQSRNAKAGELAGYVNARGYLIVKINRKQYKAHRLLYRMYNSVDSLDPSIHIDHIDGDKTNNSPENLRLATPSENQYNTRKRINNKSGHKNILKIKWENKTSVNYYWRVDIRYNGGRYVKDFNYEEPLPESIIKHASEMRSQLHGGFSNE